MILLVFGCFLLGFFSFLLLFSHIDNEGGSFPQVMNLKIVSKVKAGIILALGIHQRTYFGLKPLHLKTDR